MLPARTTCITNTNAILQWQLIHAAVGAPCLEGSTAVPTPAHTAACMYLLLVFVCGLQQQADAPATSAEAYMAECHLQQHPAQPTACCHLPGCGVWHSCLRHWLLPWDHVGASLWPRLAVCHTLGVVSWLLTAAR
jgi:hypothetical protein